MANKLAISTKRALINQANTTVVVLTSVAVFVFIFCAVASKALISQAGYQNRIISGKRVAVTQLREDVDAAGKLKSSYNAFIGTSQNILGGVPTGTGPQDGNNAKIILDALPSAYDYPALTTSLEKLFTSQGMTFTSIDGTDDEVAQSGNTSSDSPKPVPMPFEVVATGGYPNIQGVIDLFQRSIRPLQIQQLDIRSDQGVLTLKVTGQTYYQPAKSLNIKSEVVK